MCTNASLMVACVKTQIFLNVGSAVIRLVPFSQAICPFNLFLGAYGLLYDERKYQQLCFSNKRS